MAPPGGGRHALICRRSRAGSVAGGTTRCEICPPVLHAMSCRGPSWREPARDRAAVSHVASQISCCRPAAALGGWCASDHAEVPTQCRPGRGCHGLFEDAPALMPSCRVAPAFGQSHARSRPHEATWRWPVSPRTGPEAQITEPWSPETSCGRGCGRYLPAHAAPKSRRRRASASPRPRCSG